MNLTTEERLKRLLQLAQELDRESADLCETESDLQLWYNRGYADGMVQRLSDLGYAPEVDKALGRERVRISAEQRFLPWGKAYWHGYEMGEQETFEVLGEKNR
jgi:hypothetical protein